jgi:hypothetical protein
MEPHSPFDFAAEGRDRFEPAAFSPPRIGPDDGPQIPEVFNTLTESEKCGIIAAYYTSVRFPDRNIGIVLHKLAKFGLDRNPPITVTSSASTPFREAQRIRSSPASAALMRRWPGHLKPSVVRGLTEHMGGDRHDLGYVGGPAAAASARPHAAPVPRRPRATPATTSSAGTWRPSRPTFVQTGISSSIVPANVSIGIG